MTAPAAAAGLQKRRRASSILVMTEQKSLAGTFLIADYELGDPNFVETVVLLVSHDQNGAFGLVVNRRSQLSLGAAAPSYRESPFAAMPLYLGGPVEQEYLFTIHSGFGAADAGSPHARLVAPGIHFEPDFGYVERAILDRPQQLPPKIRLFSGYSGWGPGQLEGELAEKSWALLPAVPELVFSDRPDHGWRDALKRKGGIYNVVAVTGSKPSLN